ncbi:hypothetical protein BCV71DRAFT_277083 [Rhizopus microsporus]|uniref:Uncharacterized protein n=1 Tax=Rhizopus microsporus TaxID=58291 RepID=A0A1X0RPF7_RHIZD|nr:hypothetical protein BCV71DRAFT_277083 [Rhizopus microsporus]
MITWAEFDTCKQDPDLPKDLRISGYSLSQDGHSVLTRGISCPTKYLAGTLIISSFGVCFWNPRCKYIRAHKLPVNACSLWITIESEKIQLQGSLLPELNISTLNIRNMDELHCFFSIVANLICIYLNNLAPFWDVPNMALNETH